jgi:predicted glutamine amidotransferase
VKWSAGKGSEEVENSPFSVATEIKKYCAMIHIRAAVAKEVSATLFSIRAFPY